VSVSRLNYTGRKRIPREHVTIGVSGTGVDAVVGATFDLKALGFPATARVVLEAQAGWTVQRFEFGTVGQHIEPSDRRLTEFSSLAGLLFRLKVIATGDYDGRLLGVADKLKASGDIEQSAQQSFVVVRPHDLGDRVWKIEFDEAQPLLLVNSRLLDHQDFLKRKDVAALVLPEALHRILATAAEQGADDETGGGWQTMAIRLGERLAGRAAPPSTEDEELERWVDEAVGAFSRRHQFIDAFVSENAGEVQ
jgi:hypothetical protein